MNTPPDPQQLAEMEARLALLGALCRSHASLFSVDKTSQTAELLAQSPLEPDIRGLEQNAAPVPLARLPLLGHALRKNWVVSGPYGVLQDNLPLQQCALPAQGAGHRALLMERSLGHHPPQPFYGGRRRALMWLWREVLGDLVARRHLFKLPVSPFGLVWFDPAGEVTLQTPYAEKTLQRVLGRQASLSPLLSDDFYETLGVPHEHRGLGAARQTVLRTPPTFTTLTLIQFPPKGAALVVNQQAERLPTAPAARLREKYVQEIHHRVKNNFQMAASLLQMQVRQHADDPRVVQALATAIGRLRSLTVVYDFLSQQGGQTVHLPGLLRELCNELTRLGPGAKTPQMRVACEVAYVPGEVATKLALLVNELVSNALKHQGDQPPDHEGRVDVTLTLVGADVELLVADNGPGPPMGFELAHARGLGLRIVRSIVEEDLGGTLTLERREGQTRLKAVFPRSALR